VPAKKLTFTAAMRARDVSRPRAEHLAAAEAAEPGPGAAGSGGPGPAGAAGQADPAGAAGQANPAGAAGGSKDKAKPSRVAAAMDERRGQAGFPRRRRGRPSR
jgi:hypothetical protein